MRAILLIVVVAAFGGLAWSFLRGEADRCEDVPDAAAREGCVPPASAEGAAPAGDLAVAPPAPRVDPENELRWRQTRLVLPEGRGIVTGRDLLAAVETAGVLSVRADEADLAALREARFPEVSRGGEIHHLVLEPMLRDAGFDVVVHGASLRLRKRPPGRGN